ncbi:nucleoside hydrolase [Lignipirellula cremea]|uniref:Pyrimidine-specific ribonucleoside hydrolase RihA n=1 Tax=Lignipirellula cremea TaxID=2528010 RepID=A0A518DMR2_9BACT|nr:nucleoside hydrolase [Lignipirellula cremea]QDU93130.1 Pyrimidine-specific ribonucleoside hydrolase RihA [Lignipirellula cremea]
MRRIWYFCFLLLAGCCPIVSLHAAQPVIIDTDIGSAVDDAFALGLALASPELEIRGITTCGAQAGDRAWLVCRFLTHLDRHSIPVAAGTDPQPDYPLDWQIQYRRHPAVVWNRTAKPLAAAAPDFIYQQLQADPGNVTLLCLGPLTNIAKLFQQHPDAIGMVKQVVLMGGALEIGYEGKGPATAEWNIHADIRSAQAVFTAGAPLLVAPLDASIGLQPTAAQREQLFAHCSPLTFQVQSLYELSDEPSPTLYDWLAVALAVDPRLAQLKPLHLVVTDKGVTQAKEGKANARVAEAADASRLLDWGLKRLLGYDKTRLPLPPENASSLIAAGPLPARVHTFEDYDTDIEKRWWMTGMLEIDKAPPGRGRAQRAVLTQDFDGKNGDLATSYRAVIFNPVPGPPMGPQTRLAFRYHLHGTDTLRVQLFSLSNGYHRYLAVSGLQQDAWATAAVDLTAMRKPNGEGGPLAENERIDDIQFYIDPRAELLIDDIVLYEAAAPDERRPFPDRILFTGGFDTGKQGAEWPGDFEIAAHASPRTWRYARSVDQNGQAVIRLNLRGQRAGAERLRLRFDYWASAAAKLDVSLHNQAEPAGYRAASITLPAQTWGVAYGDFAAESADDPATVDELLFRLPAGVELRLDNVLLYVPGK